MKPRRSVTTSPTAADAGEAVIRDNFDDVLGQHVLGQHVLGQHVIGQHFLARMATTIGA